MIKSNELYKLVNDIDGFGETMYKSLTDYCKLHLSGIEDLLSYFTIKKEKSNSSGTDLSNKIFVITGSLNHYKNRDELVENILSHGGKVSNSISKKTSYLICNDGSSNSSKKQKANILGIKVINENEYISMVGDNF